MGLVGSEAVKTVHPVNEYDAKGIYIQDTSKKHQGVMTSFLRFRASQPGHFKMLGTGEARQKDGGPASPSAVPGPNLDEQNG